MLKRRALLATAIIAAAPFSVFCGSVAQEQPANAGDPPIDFVIRPSQDIDQSGRRHLELGQRRARAFAAGEADRPAARRPGRGRRRSARRSPARSPSRCRCASAESAARRTEDPFAQRGVDLGSFVIRPSIEIGVSATDNAGGSADKVAAVGLVVAPEINVRSEGERYEFEADASAESTSYERTEFDQRTAQARAKLRYDLTSRTSVFTEAAYSRFLEGFSDPDTPTAASERPAVDEPRRPRSASSSASAGSQRGSPASWSAPCMRTCRSPAAAPPRARNSTTRNSACGCAPATHRAPACRPFMEAAIGRRDFDHTLDDSGFARSSVWGELRGGLVIDRGDKLSGEVSLGFATRTSRTTGSKI